MTGTEASTAGQRRGFGVDVGGSGVKGFFEKTFAPLGLRKIQAETLENLKREVEKS